VSEKLPNHNGESNRDERGGGSLVATISIVPNDWKLVNNEVEVIGKEAVVASIVALGRHLPGGTERKQRKPQPGQPVCLA
jgi:hypothetical protein